MMISIGREVSCTELPFVAAVFLDPGDADIARPEPIVLSLEAEDLEFPNLDPIGDDSQRLFKPSESYLYDDGSRALFYRGDVKGLRSGAYRIKLHSTREGQISHGEENVWLLDQRDYFDKGLIENSEEFEPLPRVSAREAAVEISTYLAEKQLDPGGVLRGSSIVPVYVKSDQDAFEFLSHGGLGSDIFVAASKVRYIAEGLGEDYRYLAHCGLSILIDDPRKFGPSGLTFSSTTDGGLQVNVRLQLRTPLGEPDWRAFEQYSETAQMSRFGSTGVRFTFSQNEAGLVEIGVTLASETEPVANMVESLEAEEERPIDREKKISSKDYKTIPHPARDRPQASKTTKQPNILILWGNSIGIWNISYFSRGMMGYQTPNIDRLAQEGVCFTDYYGQQSSTAGRAAFICGQNPLRTGLTKVGMPGATIGLQPEDPTIAELLKPLGYATGHFGTNRLGDRNEFLPSTHGFDEFFGNLYHLFAEEETELPDYPRDPKFKALFGPRGVLHCFATDKDDATVDPRWGRVGRQTIEDTGPLTKKRMETIDEEITAKALGWMEKQVKADKPFFLWYNSTAMHFRTHLADKNRGKSGQDDYSDRMVTHDEQIGMMLDKLDELGITDNTIVMYSTDSGPQNDTWPDGGNTPFRGQKDTNWEGGWRVPSFVRWPGKIKASSVLNGIVSHQDMLPTLLAAAGDPEISLRLLNGYVVGNKTFKVHIDGVNLLPYITGAVKESPRTFFVYVSDDGGVSAVRTGDWKLVFEVQRATSTGVWAEPIVKLRLPLIFNLRRDPFERADYNSNVYYDWLIDHVPQLYQCQVVVAAQIENYVKYPPRQKAASFNLDMVMASLHETQAAVARRE